METHNNDKFVVVGTKVSPRANERLEALAARKGLTKYELVQMVCDTLIRYMDDRHNLTPDMEQAMSIFEHLNGWSGALNLADPTATPQVGEAIYFLSDDSGKKRGMRAVMVQRPFMGQWTQNYNVQEILERVMSCLAPEMYMRLRNMAASLECSSMVELLNFLLDMHSRDEDLRSFRECFEDNDRSDYGIKPVASPYKRRHARTMEQMDKTPNLFSDDE